MVPNMPLKEQAMTLLLTAVLQEEKTRQQRTASIKRHVENKSKIVITAFIALNDILVNMPGCRLVSHSHSLLS